MKHPSEPCRQSAEKGYRVPAQTVINLRPMRLSRRPEPFDSDEYLFELKIDGFRALAHIADGKGELVSRNGNVFRGFADLATWIAEHLKTRLQRSALPKVCTIYVAFDLLYLNGKDLRTLPLVERKTTTQKAAAPKTLTNSVPSRSRRSFRWSTISSSHRVQVCELQTIAPHP
jgi:ATP-dependent DNA ligase